MGTYSVLRPAYGDTPIKALFRAATDTPGVSITSDLSTTGWTGTPGPALYTMINESVRDDLNYITSPDIAPGGTSSVVFGVTGAVPGSYSVKVVASALPTSGSLIIRFLDDADTQVGVTSAQALSGSLALYPLSTTLSATATKVKFEVTA